MNGNCPACRQTYEEKNITYRTDEEIAALSCKGRPQVSEEERQRRVRRGRAAAAKKAAAVSAKYGKKKRIGFQERKRLSNVRVVQRTLLYVIGIAPKIAKEDVLRKQEYFGQYGEIVKVVVNRSYVSGHNSASAYITFAREEDAREAIRCVDGCTVLGRQMHASYGTTKYCNAFLRGIACSNSDCLYLHKLGGEEDSFTKAEMLKKKGVFQAQIHPKRHSSQNSNNRTTGLPAPSKEHVLALQQPDATGSSADGQPAGASSAAAREERGPPVQKPKGPSPKQANQKQSKKPQQMSFAKVASRGKQQHRRRGKGPKPKPAAWDPTKDPALPAKSSKSTKPGQNGPRNQQSQPPRGKRNGNFHSKVPSAKSAVEPFEAPIEYGNAASSHAGSENNQQGIGGNQQWLQSVLPGVNVTFGADGEPSSSSQNSSQVSSKGAPLPAPATAGAWGYNDLPDVSHLVSAGDHGKLADASNVKQSTTVAARSKPVAATQHTTLSWADRSKGVQRQGGYQGRHRH